MDLNGHILKWSRLIAESDEFSDEKLEYGAALMQMESDPTNFLSTNRKLSLTNDCQRVEPTDLSSARKVDAQKFGFTDVEGEVKMELMPKGDRWGIHFRIELQDGRQYVFIPTTANVVKFGNMIGLDGIKKKDLVVINDQVMDIANAQHTSVFTHALNESDDDLKRRIELTKDNLKNRILNSLKEIEMGGYSKHNDSKLQRLNLLKSGGKLDIGNVWFSYIEPKTTNHRDSDGNTYFTMTDKIVAFGFGGDGTLREFAFKDIYGFCRALKLTTNITNNSKIPMDRLMLSIENQSSGRSTQDNETSNRFGRV